MKEIVIDGTAYMPVKEAAALASYTPDYVGQLCRAGKLIATRVGRSWYVNEHSLIEHKEAQLTAEEDQENAPLEGPAEKEEMRSIPAVRSSIFDPSTFIVYGPDERPLLPELKPAQRSEPVRLEPEPQSAVRTEKPVFVQTKEVKQVDQTLENIFRVSAYVGRVLMGVAAFVAVFVLVFSLNGSYTGSLIRDAVTHGAAAVAKTKAGGTVYQELIVPFEYAAIGTFDTINTRMEVFLYGVPLD